MAKDRRRVAVVAAAIFVLGACARGEQGSAPASPSPSETEEARGDELTLQMKARNDSGQDGTAILTATPDGKTQVDLDLRNSPGGPQPSHINSGTCDDLGEIVHVLGGMRGGKLQAIVDVSLDSLLAGTFAVNVAKSPQEFGVSASCAEIKR